jgi:tetratricopeptide (TPR) repeat protein
VRGVKTVFTLSLLAYLLLIFPFTTYLKNRPLQFKIGYVPEAKVIKILTADQCFLVADWVILKVVFYFGSLLEKNQDDKLYAVNPDYPAMFRILQTGLRLDPYNADAYYFAQAVYTWDVGKVREVNNMLEYGMKYRTWDYQLPFFAGFNAAYFLKDYKKAAEYMKKAAEIAQEQQFATLAARYFYEAGETEFGILFIDMMKGSAKDANEKKLYEFRKKALLAVRQIENAGKLFQQKSGIQPASIEQLVSSGYLPNVPRDPYGGKFYLDELGKVRSTSKLSFAGAAAAKENR